MKATTFIQRNYGSKILYYHDVFATKNFRALDVDTCMGTPLSLFKQHVNIIREEGFEIVREITKPVRQVAIMFDDGFRGIWECRKYFYDENIKPTIFLPIEYIGRTQKGMLSLEEILELQSHGFRFESHGWSHRPLTEVPDEEFDKELNGSKKKLSEILGKEVTEICMPLGYFSEKVLEKIHEAGYEKVYSCLPGTFNEAPYGLIARNLCQFASPYEVMLILRGGNDLLKSRYLRLHKH